MKVFFWFFFQIALASAGYCQVIGKSTARISGSSKSESISCPKPNQYQNRIRYGKREFIDFDLTNDYKVIAGQDTLSFRFQKTEGQWIEKISTGGKELLSITFSIQKCEGDTSQVYNLNGDFSQPDYLVIYKSYTCEIKTVEFADYEEAKKQPYIRRFFQSLAKE